jgi:hypothetical protein
MAVFTTKVLGDICKQKMLVLPLDVSLLRHWFFGQINSAAIVV